MVVDVVVVVLVVDVVVDVDVVVVVVVDVEVPVGGMKASSGGLMVMAAPISVRLLSFSTTVFSPPEVISVILFDLITTAGSPLWSAIHISPVLCSTAVDLPPLKLGISRVKLNSNS